MMALTLVVYTDLILKTANNYLILKTANNYL